MSPAEAPELRALKAAAAARKRAVDAEKRVQTKRIAASDDERAAVLAALRAGVPRKTVIEASSFAVKVINDIKREAGLTRPTTTRKSATRRK